MGFTYLNGENWLDVTREERLFCSHLYQDIIGKEKGFILWLNENKKFDLKASDDWEVGYEVCFYRDLLKLRKESINSTDYSSKRTFDLCLFSENAIVIIEAKVQQMFNESQIKVFEKDRHDIRRITGKNIEVLVVALASSKYFDNYNRYGKHNILAKFDARITWEEMYDLYKNEIYLKAKGKYKN